MGKTFYMKWNGADFRRDTAELSTDAELCYRRLLEFMFERGGRLRNDPKALAALGRVRGSNWARVWAEIEHYFEATADGHITQHRIAVACSDIESRSAARSKVALEREAQKLNKNNEAKAQDCQSRDITINHKPLSIEEREEPNGSLSETPPPAASSDPQVSRPSKSDPGKTRAVRQRPAYPEDFEDFWKAYPTDPLMSKKEAGAAWTRLSAEDRIAARGAVAGFAAHCRATPDYRPLHAVRFISQRRFEGYAEGAATSGAEQQLKHIAEQFGVKLVGMR